MNGRSPTPIFATNFVSEERDLALRGFVSPLGSRARQTSMSGSLGTFALYATPPITFLPPESTTLSPGRAAQKELRLPRRANRAHRKLRFRHELTDFRFCHV